MGANLNAQSLQNFAHQFKSDGLINFLFLINSIGASLLLPSIIIFFFGITLSEEDILILGGFKFWSHSLFSFFILFFVDKISSRKGVFLSFFMKLFAFCFLFFGQDFIFCLFTILVNGLGSALFSTSSKLYLKENSLSLSDSFSIRNTIHNVGASISPVVISVCIFFNFGMCFIVSFLVFFFSVSIFLSFKLKGSVFNKDRKEIGSEVEEKANINLVFLIISVSAFFSIYYYLFETVLPLVLSKNNIEYILSPLMLFNTILIVSLQVPLYRFATSKLNDENSLFFVVIVSVLFLLPFFFFDNNVLSLAFLVLGISVLEMFYSTAVDTVISKRSSRKLSSRLYAIASFSISFGVFLASFLYFFNINILIVVMFSLILLFYFFKKRLLS